MGLLGDVYSYGDTLKRKVGGLLSDPRGTLEQFVGQLGDDMNTNISNMKTGYGFGGNKSVLSDPAQVQAAQRALADYGAQSGMAAATVWHGSPHKFDKFDSSKIGTGEGAQAYGHGLYLAESPDVAGSYAQSVKANSGELVKRGAAHGLPEDVASNLAAALQSGKKFDPVIDAARKMIDDPLASASQRAAAQRLIDNEMAAYNAWSEWSKPGQIYKVDLPDEHIAKMLDWDKPLSQQHPDVQSILGKFDADSYHPSGGDYDANELGQQIYNRLAGVLNVRNPSPASGMVKATDYLQKQGIPGIRYLDGGSRGAGQGSSNFVVFPGNEGLLSILERNNKALDIFKDTTWEPPLFPDTTR